MAEIVLALATSHTPQLSIPDWRLLQTKDETDPRLDYPGLLSAAAAHIRDETTPDKVRERFEACQQALKVLGDRLREAPGRCYALGRCIRAAVESWKPGLRVAVMASARYPVHRTISACAPSAKSWA